MGGAEEEDVGEGLGKHGGYGSGLVRLCRVVLTTAGAWAMMDAFTPHYVSDVRRSTQGC
jgi:hypothetical protein